MYHKSNQKFRPNQNSSLITMKNLRNMSKLLHNTSKLHPNMLKLLFNHLLLYQHQSLHLQQNQLVEEGEEICLPTLGHYLLSNNREKSRKLQKKSLKNPQRKKSQSRSQRRNSQLLKKKPQLSPKRIGRKDSWSRGKGSEERKRRKERSRWSKMSQSKHIQLCFKMTEFMIHTFNTSLRKRR